MTDLRDTIFASLAGRQFIAQARFVEPGLVTGISVAAQKCSELGCEVLTAVEDGTDLPAGEPFLKLRGDAKAIAMAEDFVPGLVAKVSGVARQARRAKELSRDRVRIVCGAAKKVDPAVRFTLRRALACGGIAIRMVDEPFVYLDKNYVRMFGSVRNALTAVSHMTGMTKTIQLRGLLQPIETETRDALELGAGVLMVDTGRVEDLDMVSAMACDAGKRGDVRIAFAGNVVMDDVEELMTHDVDIIGLGRAIIDAPMADVTFDVITEPSED